MVTPAHGVERGAGEPASRGQQKAGDGSARNVQPGGERWPRAAGVEVAGVRSRTHLPDARSSAASTGAARAPPLPRDSVPAAAGAPGPESHGRYRGGQSGDRPRARGGVHRGRWEGNSSLQLPQRQPTALPGNSIAPASVRCSRAFARSSPKAAAGFPAATLRPLRTGAPPSCWRREAYSAHARWARRAGVPLFGAEGLDCAAAAAGALPLRFG